MRDLFARIIENKGPLGKWASQAEGYFVFPKLEGPISNRMKFQGKEVITWSINDYLGMANLPEIKKVDGETAAEYGAAYPMGARMMSGHTDFHEQLEKELADFVHKESSYLLNFGYQVILSAIDALVSKDDIIVYDVDSHACIIDGVRLHMGKRFTFVHNDIDSLKKNLERATKMAEQTGGGILVISEGVFGMRGEQGKLKESVEAFYKAIKFNEQALLKKDLSNVYKCLGIALARDGKIPEAIKPLKKAIEGFIQKRKDSPKSLQVCENLAGSYTALAQAAGAIGKTEDTLAAHKGAIKTYSIAARLDPANVNYYVEAIKAYLYIDESDEAIKLLDNAINAMLKYKQPDQVVLLRQFRNSILQQLQSRK